MAKVTGPLMSMDASGSVGGTLTFSKWVGRSYVRHLVIPSNPQTADQMTVRNAFSVMGKATAWAGKTSEMGDGRSETDATLLQQIAPADQRWNGYVVSIMTQTSAAAYQNAMSAYSALDETAKTDWDDAAEALSPSIAPAPQKSEGGVTEDPISAGNVFFIYQWALYVAGIIESQPSETPPNYT